MAVSKAHVCKVGKNEGKKDLLFGFVPIFMGQPFRCVAYVQAQYEFSKNNPHCYMLQKALCHILKAIFVQLYKIQRSNQVLEPQLSNFLCHMILYGWRAKKS